MKFRLILFGGGNGGNGGGGGGGGDEFFSSRSFDFEDEPFSPFLLNVFKDLLPLLSNNLLDRPFD